MAKQTNTTTLVDTINARLYTVVEGKTIDIKKVTNPEDYQSKGVEVFEHILVKGKLAGQSEYAVRVKDYVRPVRTPKTLEDKISALTNGADLSSMSAADLVALIKG